MHRGAPHNDGASCGMPSLLSRPRSLPRRCRSSPRAPTPGSVMFPARPRAWRIGRCPGESFCGHAPRLWRVPEPGVRAVTTLSENPRLPSPPDSSASGPYRRLGWRRPPCQAVILLGPASTPSDMTYETHPSTAHRQYPVVFCRPLSDPIAERSTGACSPSVRCRSRSGTAASLSRRS